MGAKMKNNITVLIEARNVEGEINKCVESARKLASEIILVDIESTDRTIQLAEKENVKVYSFPFTLYVEPARQFGIEKIKTEWVFIMDSDERMTQELAQEIKKTIKNSSFSHFRIPRKNIFGKKKWLKHGGWWPDHQIRLIHIPSFKRWPKEIHSTPVVDGQMGILQNPFLHYFHGDFESMVTKTSIFEDVESDLLLEANRTVSVLIFFRKFAGELFRRLIRRGGFLDGRVGIIEAVYQAFSKTITYLYLYEKKNSRSL